MVAYFQELQPVDAYQIQLSQPFSEYDQKLLTLLYQPLIGAEAITLYMTLWADAESQNEAYTHYHLMNVLSLPLAPIFEARISLEAIGLLRTYVSNEQSKRSFIYQLEAPLDAKAFFEDPLLSTFLFSKIGEQPYRSLRERFLKPMIDDTTYKEVSRTFLDVYQPIHQAIEAVEGELIGKNGEQQLPFEHYSFDFELLRSGLSEQMVPQAAIAKLSKQVIEKIAFMYSLTPIDMQKIMMLALDENLEIPEQKLRKAAADYYKMNTSKKPPQLEKVFQPPVQKVERKAMTREEELIDYLTHISPVEMLRDLKGKEPMAVDVELAERLVLTHQFSSGVVNVLLQYVYLINDGKITNKFVERIASHWMNKEVSTVKEALTFSRIEHDKYMKWKNEEKKASKSNTKKSYNNSQKKEVVPEWFYKEEDHKQQETKQTTNSDIEERRRKLRESLSKPMKGMS